MLSSRIIKKRECRETYLPTQQAPPLNHSWIFSSHEYRKWTTRYPQPSQKRTEAINGIRLTFPKKRRLLTRRDYTRAPVAASRCVGKYLLIDTHPNPLHLSRLGLVVSKQYGDAHERNRFKRVVREAFRLNQNNLPLVDLVIKPRKLAKEASFQNICDELKRLLVTC